jgi:hypothetical protein
VLAPQAYDQQILRLLFWKCLRKENKVFS